MSVRWSTALRPGRPQRDLHGVHQPVRAGQDSAPQLFAADDLHGHFAVSLSVPPVTEEGLLQLLALQQVLS